MRRSVDLLLTNGGLKVLLAKALEDMAGLLGVDADFFAICVKEGIEWEEYWHLFGENSKVGSCCGSAFFSSCGDNVE